MSSRTSISRSTTPRPRTQSEVSSRTAALATTSNTRDLKIEIKSTVDDDGCDINLRLRVHLPTTLGGTIVSLFKGDNYRYLSSRIVPLDAVCQPVPTKSQLYDRMRDPIQLLLPVKGKNTSSALDDDLYPGHFRLQIGDNIEPSPEAAVPDGASASKHARRSSFSGRKEAIFEIHIRLWVPLDSRVPDIPYSLSLDIPRSLQNHARIDFPSVMPSTKTWDIASEPPLSLEKISGSSPMSVEGNFQCSQSLLLRWAMVDKQASRKRSNGALVRSVDSNTLYTVLQKDADQLVVKVDFQAICEGIYTSEAVFRTFVSLVPDLFGCHASWFTESERWKFEDVDGATVCDADRHFSNGRPRTSQPIEAARSQWTASRASLIRAPLPDAAGTAGDLEYSFEETLGRSQSPPVPSGGRVFSPDRELMSPSPEPRNDSPSSMAGDYAPSHPITFETALHRIPKERISFRFSGILAVRPSSSQPGVVPLPVFRFPRAEFHEGSTTVKVADSVSGSLSVLTRAPNSAASHSEILDSRNAKQYTVPIAANPSTNIDGKSGLLPAHCLTIELKPFRQKAVLSTPLLSPVSRSSSPSSNTVVGSPGPSPPRVLPKEIKQSTAALDLVPPSLPAESNTNGAVRIPSMHVTVTPHAPSMGSSSTAVTLVHYVHLSFPWPSQLGAERIPTRTLKVVLARPIRRERSVASPEPTSIEVIEASVGGRLSVTRHKKLSPNDQFRVNFELGDEVAIELPPGKEGGLVELFYQVNDYEAAIAGAPKDFDLRVVWPIFDYPVSSISVELMCPKDYDLPRIVSDFLFQTAPTKLARFQMPGFHIPKLNLSYVPTRTNATAVVRGGPRRALELLAVFFLGMLVVGLPMSYLLHGVGGNLTLTSANRGPVQAASPSVTRSTPVIPSASILADVPNYGHKADVSDAVVEGGANYSPHTRWQDLFQSSKDEDATTSVPAEADWDLPEPDSRSDNTTESTPLDDWDSEWDDVAESDGRTASSSSPEGQVSLFDPDVIRQFTHQLLATKESQFVLKQLRTCWNVVTYLFAH